MTSAIKKTANALSAESDLLNLYSDLKAVAGKHDSLISVQTAASKRLLKWAEGSKGVQGEDPIVSNFIQGVCEVDDERDNAEKQYNEHFRIFVKLWKGILQGKKDLNAVNKDFESVVAKRKAAEKKKEKMASKGKREDQVTAEHAHDAAVENEMQMAANLRLKEVEVQQNKHEALRRGYIGLYEASMTRMKTHVLQLEKLRKLGNAVPDVLEKNPDTEEFETKPYTDETAPELPKDSPIWWQGERLNDELQMVTSKHEAEKQKLQREYSAKLNDLIRKQESAANEHQRNLHGRMSQVAGQHDSVMTGLASAHQMKLADLEQQRVDLEARHAQKVRAEAAKYAKLVKHYEAKKQELARHIEAEAVLETHIENLKGGIVNRAKTLGASSIEQAALSAQRPCIEVFLDMATQAKARADGILPVIKATGESVNAELFDTKAAELVTAVSAALLSASGAASASRAENSMDLLTAMDPAVAAATAVLKRIENPYNTTGSSANAKVKQSGGSRAASCGGGGAAAKMVRAIYKHEQKEQDGFMLVGFAKGELLTLVKHRDDGWSRVKTAAGVEGWGPTSFLKEEAAAPADDVGDDDDDELDLDGPEVMGDGGLADTTPPEELVANLKAILDEAISLAKAIKLRDRELSKLSNQLVDAIEDKVTAAQQSILDGIKLFEKLLAQTKATESGRLLEVNEQLLGIGLKLQEAMRNVINAAEGMRAALVRGKGAQSDDEFNAKHQSWFGALTTSVDAVVDGNPLLMEAVRCVLGRKGKHEELQVASRTITAAVAQLAALSRTKIVSEETAVAQVTKSCSAVIEVGTELLASARESQDLALASILMEDFDELTSNQIKRLTMATQVNVLKLEKEVEREREKLGRLRRMNYENEN